MRVVAYISLLIILVACSKNPLPKDILPIDKMESVVYDLMQTDEYLTNFVVKDSSVDIKKRRSISYEQIFRLHNVTRKQFYASYKYYQAHPDIQKTLFDSLFAEAGRRKQTPVKNSPMKPLKVKKKVF